MPFAPIGVYGKTKAAGEAAVRQNLNEYYIIRTEWLYVWARKKLCLYYDKCNEYS